MFTGDEGALGGGPPAQGRFEYWRDLVRRTRVCDATSAHVDTFTARVRRLELGPVAFLGTSFPSARLRRTERMIRSSDEEVLHLTLLTAGRQLLGRGREQRERFGPGDLHLLDSSHPYDTLLFGTPSAGPGQESVEGPVEGPGPVEGVGIDLPASLLPVPAHRLRDLFGRRLSGRQGTGALLAQFLLGLERQAALLQPAEAARLGAVVADLVGAWVAGELDAGHTLPHDARQRATVESVRAFVWRNLHDPALTPPVIAAAHHISVSHLHRLFTRYSHGETVAAYIRGRRLRKAHRDLADPALRALPIQGVAARCGFPGASEFGRAFRTVYGLTPREYRYRALGRPAGEEALGGEPAALR
ncbi:helix-turn-helix domain-containing protein [Kitasatospora sp. NPDC036755]|uniref:helix-turn-helix domain-containing protein n=1 Tax=Kitasatospora sp. NPDC036755 TaxID=3154600 RepID=UPI0033F192FB